MKSGDNNNTLERFFEEPDESIESPEPVESTPESSDELPEPDEPIDEKTDDSLYETILSWERNTEKHTDYSPDPH